MNEFIAALLQAVLIAAVPVISAFVGKGLNALAKYIAAKANNETVEKYLHEAAEAVSTAVAYTSQTYVDALKASGKFTKENQEEALRRAMEKAKSILSAEAIDFLSMAYGDLNNFLETKIEKEVRIQKTFSLPVTEGIATVELKEVPDVTAVAAATAAATAATVAQTAIAQAVPTKETAVE